MQNEFRPKGKIVIAGGSGFLGASLARRLVERACEVVVLSRGEDKAVEGWKQARWDGRTPGAWADQLDGAAALVNLAGRSVDCVKTPDHCDEILRSRVESTRVLGLAFRRVRNPPPVWVQMSTAHIYGDPPEAVCDETAALGHGLAPDVGRAWEQAFREAALPEMRTVVLRTSFVLGPQGGALRRLGLMARLGLGGTVGSGRQGISWLHEEDMNHLFLRAIADPTMTGVYLATAPNPVSNAVFMRELRLALGRRIGLPARDWMVRLGAGLLLRTDPDLALYGRYCVSRRLGEEKFPFAFPEIGPALRDVFRASRNQ